MFDFLALDLFGGGAIAQTDAARLRADLDDLEIVLLARLERTGALERAGAGAVHGRVAVVAALAVFDFGVVAESFDVVAELDKSAEGGDARNFALHDLADFVLLEPFAPDVVDLLDAKRDAAIIRIDLQDFCGDRLALFEDFVGILDALRPTDITDVNEAVEAFFDFDEGAEFGDVANFAGDDGADGIFFGDEQPGIGERLLDAEGDAAVAGLDVEDDDVDFFADFEKLGWMLDFFRPAQLGDVNEALDALFELDENAVVDDADDFAA